MKHIRNRYYFASDVGLLIVASYLSFVLRLDTFALGSFWPALGVFTALVLLITPIVFRVSGVYSRYWRYASLEEVLLLVRAVALAAVLADVFGFAITRLFNAVIIPRSVPFIFFLLALLATAGPRLVVRMRTMRTPRRRSTDRPQPVLIAGAGEAGRMIVRELRQNRMVGMEVVGFLDDDLRKQGMHIHGVPVLGTLHDLPTVAQKHAVAQVIIAMPTAPGKVIRDIKQMCEQARVKIKTIPGIYELLGGTVSVNQLRDVQIEDLLRRVPVQTDTAAVQTLLRGKRVLVTGGGGSIGSELCRQVLRCQPAELIIVGHGENSIFGIENELRAYVQTHLAESIDADHIVPTITAVIADIRFADRVRTIFEQHRPDVVFHAAAHKHVPLMERNPAEAVTNNVLGTRNLVDAALATDVERFVMISSDKAVNPTNIMGASKRAAELVVHQAAHRSGKAYAAVRFGNVLGSRGSVVLTFTQQIAAGGPVTITDGNMQRYFMTIPEAVQLVLQAAVLERGGEVFVLDMGQPVKIIDLARDMIALSGLEEGRDIDIVVTGLRPGEKLFEELFVKGEVYRRTEHEKIFIAANASSFVPAGLDRTINDLAAAAAWDDRHAIVHGLQTLVPEFAYGAPRGENECAPLSMIAVRPAPERTANLPVSKR